MSIKLNVGALGPTIAEQVAAQGYKTSMPAATLDRYEHAIHLLRLHGLLTQAESDKALKRLIREMGATRNDAAIRSAALRNNVQGDERGD
jgi:hypothetical protein